MAAPSRSIEHFKAVADVYMAAQRADNPAPGRAVADAFGCSQACASEWTRKARSLGFITTPAPHHAHRARDAADLRLVAPAPPLDSTLETPLQSPTDLRVAPARRDEVFGEPADLAHDLASLRRVAARVGRLVDAETSADRLVSGARTLAILTSQIRAAERAIWERNKAIEAAERAKFEAEKAERERLDALNDEFAHLANGNWIDT